MPMVDNPVWEICERMAEVQGGASIRPAPRRIYVKQFRRFGRAPAKVAIPPCVDGSELARTFFTYAALVGAPMCSAFECGSHDRWP
jgi:hypothetical protein